MTVEKILSDDAPLSAYYGHPRGVQGWEDKGDTPNKTDSPIRREVKGRRSQWTVTKDAKRRNSWRLYWQTDEHPSLEVWVMRGAYHYRWTRHSHNFDGKPHKSSAKSMAAFIRELNA